MGSVFMNSLSNENGLTQEQLLEFLSQPSANHMQNSSSTPGMLVGNNNNNQPAGVSHLGSYSSSFGSLPNGYRQGFPNASISYGGNNTFQSRSRLQFPSQIILPNPEDTNHSGGFVASNNVEEALTTTQQQANHYSHHHHPQIGFMGRSSSMCQRPSSSNGVRNRAFNSNAGSCVEHKNVEATPEGFLNSSISDHHSMSQSQYYTDQMTGEQLQQDNDELRLEDASHPIDSQSYMHFDQPSGEFLPIWKQSKQQNVSMFNPVQDETQQTHHHSERSNSFTTRQSECSYCRHFPFLFEYFVKRTRPLFRKQHLGLCLKLDQLTWHLRNCNDRHCGCDKYRLIYKHFVDSYCAAACNLPVKRFPASFQNVDSGSSKSNRGIRRICEDKSDADRQTKLKTQKIEHSFPPHSSNEFCKASTSIDQPHYCQEGLTQMFQQIPMPLSDQTKVMEIKIDKSEDSQVIHPSDDQMEGKESEAEGRGGVLPIEPFTSEEEFKDHI